jgi:hypothetical protein
MPELDMAPLKGRRLFVGTPMYDGKCHSEYAFAIAQLTGLCARFGIELQLLFLTHEALITKARNIIADRFVQAGGDHLIFIDGDIGFDPRDALHVMALQTANPAYDVIAAPYPTKQIQWDTILRAARAGVADGEADLLARYSSRIAVHPAHGPTFPLAEPVEVTQAGTGFMMIRAETFARYRDHYPHRAYGAQGGGTDGNAPHPIHAFFETEIDSKHANIAREIKAYVAARPEATADDILAFLDSDAAAGRYGGRHISEDYAFCRRVREAGMQVWLCPWMELSHMGSHRFASRLADMGAIGAA